MPKLWRAKKQFSRFLFSVLFQQEIIDLAINDFTMHLLISKWLKIQKCRQEKTIRQRNFQQKCFHSFNYVLDHTSIHFLRKLFKLLLLISSVLLTESFNHWLIHSFYNLIAKQIFYFNFGIFSSKWSTKKSFWKCKVK